MREIFEFRIDESVANKTALADVGEIIGGWIRVIKVERTDHLFEKIGQLQFRMKREGKSFFLNWRVRREYSHDEQDRAQLFLLSTDSTIEPCGEQSGSEYSDENACHCCGVGAELKSALILKGSSFGNKDIARTIANEWLASQKVVEIAAEAQFTGCEFTPVYQKNRRGKLEVIVGWFQLTVTGAPIDLTHPTQFGIDPFDPDIEGQFKCPLGHKYGLNLISEAYVPKTSWNRADLVRSAGFVGDRRGVLRPTPLLFISPKFRKLLMERKIKGLKTEVAHFLA